MRSVSRADETIRHFPWSFDFAPIAQYAGQFFRRAVVHDVGGGQPSAAVHPHVQWRFAPKRESPFDNIEVMRRDAQVGQYAVHLGYAPQP